MFRYFKLKIRKIIPNSFQVPLKYWYCFARGFIEPEMALLKKIIRPSSVAIDIGGNRGIYSYYISKLCKRIEIFEPNPTCFNILESWASTNEGINVHNLALSSQESISKLFIPIDIDGVEHDSSGSIQKNTSANSRFEMVELQRLDAFRFEKIDFIKIDVEGHELSVLEGAKQILKDYKPALLVEIEQRHNKQPIEEIFNFLKSYGYKGYFFHAGYLENIASFNQSIHQKEKNLNSNDLYINNFLFLNKWSLDKGKYTDLINLLKK